MRGLVFGRTGGVGAGVAAAAIVIVLLVAGCAPSRLSNKDAWCTQFTDDASIECSYRTLQQCLATISALAASASSTLATPMQDGVDNAVASSLGPGDMKKGGQVSRPQV